MISALPDTPHVVHVLLPPGGRIAIPPSTSSDTHWMVLLDGSQFTYAALRCTVEFDHNHSISNSMRPPEIPRTIDHTPVFNDKDLLPNCLDLGPSHADVSKPGDASRSTVAKELRITETRAQTPSSGKGDTSKKENATAEKASHDEKLRERPHLNLNLVPPPLQATKITASSQKIGPAKAPRSSRQPAELACAETTAARPSQSRRPATARSRRLHEEQEQDEQALPIEQVAKVLRKPGEQSQVLHTNNNKESVLLTRQDGEESQILHTNMVNHGAHLVRKHGEESQVLYSNETKRHGHVARQAGEKSQVLPKQAVIGPQGPPRERTSITKMQVKSTTFVKRVLNDESEIPRIRKVSFDDQVESVKQDSRGIPGARAAKPALSAKPKSVAVTSPVQQEDPIKVQHSKQLPVEFPAVLAQSIPKKRSASDVSSGRHSPPKTQSRLVSPYQPGTDYSTDVSTASSNSTVSLEGRKKRRRSPRKEIDLLDPPARPVIVFSSQCEIQTKKQAMKTFSQLGGEVTEDTAKANMLCVSDKDDLKKTSKLILAIILGHVIVTETWLINSCRKNKLLAPESYQPKSKARELEWGVKLPTALNRGLSSDAMLHELFLDCKLYLTKQLQKLLMDTNNLKGFRAIAMAMGATSVKTKLPVKAGSKTIVLGVDGDFNALAVSKLGLALYDKDLLTISALRGRREDASEEFKIDIPIKEEPLSQS